MIVTIEPGEPRCPPALAGIRVLEMAHVLSGPLCAMLLADLGAEVVKVESADRPDSMRTAGATLDGESVAFRSVNRNKRGMRLDLRDDDDRAAFADLVAGADVLVENFRPGVMERLGFGYEACRALNPGLVYASISGFGATGPIREQGGYDVVAQAMSGIMSVTGDAEGPPEKAGVPVTDVGAALYAALGIMAALRARDRCGHGQHVDCALLDVGISYGVWEAAEVWATGEPPARFGTDHRALAPYRRLGTRDGYFVIAANSDELFAAAAAALGHPEWSRDPRFATNRVRLENRAELARTIESVTRGLPGAEVVRRLVAAGVPAGEVLDHRDALSHEQAVARGMVPSLAGAPVLGSPLRLSHTPVTYRSPAPPLGGAAAHESEAEG
jgi:crotonobetainyl-CoA:carnitine CoA-transferase CaiB-like acyl-CoA transferase